MIPSPKLDDREFDDIVAEALPDPDSAERILLDVRYEIRATNSIHNLVFPFYLTGS